MRRTKRAFLARYDERYVVVDFFDGKRGTIHNGYTLEGVVDIASKASMQGGFCTVYPMKYAKAVLECIDYIESTRGLNQGICNGTWLSFRASIAGYIEKLSVRESEDNGSV